MDARTAKFGLGQVVRHRVLPMRGVVYDVDPEFADRDGPLAVADRRPPERQPFYRILADDGEACCTAYVGEANLVADDTGEPVDHPATGALFAAFTGGAYRLRPHLTH